MTDHYVSMAQIRASKKIQQKQSMSVTDEETVFVEEEPYSEISFMSEEGPSVNSEEGPSVDDGDAPSCSGVSSNSSGQSSQCDEHPYVDYMPASRKVVLHPGQTGLGVSVVGGVKTSMGLIPVFITDIDPDGEVDKSMVVKVGDRILSVNGDSMEGKTHGDVVLAIRAAGNSLVLEVTEGQQDILDYISKELSDAEDN